MFQKLNLPLRSGELIVEVVRPVRVHRFLRTLIGFAVISVNAFFTFWLWQRGLEGQIFYVVAALLGIYLMLYDVFFARSNYLVITNERVFDIQRESIFSHTVSSLGLLDMVDVVVARRGIFPTLFNYGHLTLHPKDGTFTLEFQRIPKPIYVQDVLFDIREKAKKAGRLGSKDSVLKQFLKLIPDLSEAELTLLYQKIHSQLITLAEPTSEKTN